MFPMTITVHNASQLNAVLQAMQPDLQASDFASPIVGAAYEEAKAKVEANKAQSAGKPKAEKTAAAKTEPAAPTSPTAGAAATPAADAPAKKDEPSAPAGDAVTYDQVKTVILEVSKVKGREAALKLLAQFGAEKGPDLQKTPEKFGDFIAAAKKLLGV